MFSDAGDLVTRYDKRRLSTTEITYLYAPGIAPVTFEVDGVRIGMALCLEMLFPDMFVAYAYADDGVDLVLVPSAGAGIFGLLAQSYAAITSMHIALVVPPSDDPTPSTVYGPRGPIAHGVVGVACTPIAEVAARDPEPTFHFRARHGLYDPALDPDDPRTLDRQRL